ncbi:MAG: hypothetical protein NTZ09_15000 [Candidatus Hydrogenedentes bacterium]|nr:hypothetical protein [Candidatus Hydrogenedentota bacterium]
MEQTLSVLNDLVREGVLLKYAIGGGIAATFYIEPVATYDLDVFVSVPVLPSGLLLLSPIYSALKTRGFVAEGEYVHIFGIPVQFLPAYNALVEEALAEARYIAVGCVSTNVIRAEHLMAIMLETGRGKDLARLAQMLEESEFDVAVLENLIDRHGLRRKWDGFRQQPG